jgi:hypothetical protein
MLADICRFRWIQVSNTRENELIWIDPGECLLLFDIHALEKISQDLSMKRLTWRGLGGVHVCMGIEPDNHEVLALRVQPADGSQFLLQRWV